MKMNFSLVPVLSVAVLVGCQPKSLSKMSSGEDGVEVGPKYTAKQGLLVPEDTRKSLGLEITAVTEQKLSASVSFSLNVYATKAAHSLASGIVTIEQSKQLQRDQAAKVKTDSGQEFNARIISLGSPIQKDAENLEVLVEIADSGKTLEMGSFLRAQVLLPSKQDVVSVPRSALLENSEGYSVYTVSGEHLVRAVVKVGAIDGEMAEITDGLYAGDEIVLRPVMSLWMTELAAVKGGQACCVVPGSGK